MKNFILGLLIGAAAVYGTAVFADSPPATLSNTGRLESFEVLNAQGKRVCEDPFGYKEQKIIRCE